MRNAKASNNRKRLEERYDPPLERHHSHFNFSYTDEPRIPHQDLEQLYQEAREFDLWHERNPNGL